LKAVGMGQSYTASDFQSRLPSSPLWIAGKWNPKSFHIVLLVGCSDDQVEFIDPWWTGEETATRSQRFLNDFVHGDGKSVNGTDFCSTRIGSLAYWG
jgi:hypothetical protein